MKILLALLAALLISAVTSYAQQKPEVDRKKEQVFSHRPLLLDSATAGQITQIMSDYKVRKAAILEDKSLSPETRQASYKALIDDKNKKLLSVLNSYQQKKGMPDTEGDSLKRTKKN